MTMLSSNQVDFICSSELLRRIDLPLARELAVRMETVELGDGELVLRPGYLDDNLYIVLSGRLTVSRRNPRGETGLLFDVEAGEGVGSMGVRSHHLASVTIAAAGGTQLAVVPRHVFEHQTVAEVE